MNLNWFKKLPTWLKWVIGIILSLPSWIIFILIIEIIKRWFG